MKISLPQPAYLASREPYSSARSILKGEGWTFFDANESPCTLAVRPQALIDGINRYPDPLSDRLRSALARRYGVSAEQVVVGNGSDELIALCVQTFVRPERTVVMTEPTYGMYRVCAQSLGRRCVTVPLCQQDFSLDGDVLERAGKTADLVFLCNPNNPTGSMIPPDIIGRFARRFPGVVVVDEAYGEFADAGGSPSSLEWVKRGYGNVIVLRTFSKAFGAAGIRLGYAIGSRRVCGRLLAMKLPYNVNVLSQRLGCLLLKESARMEANVRLLQSERVRVSRALEQMGYRVYPSVTNFFLFASPPGLRARRVYERLRERGMVLRAFRKPSSLVGLLRFSVGTRTQNDQFLSAVRSLLP